MQRLGALYSARTAGWLALIACLLMARYCPSAAEEERDFAGQLLVATDEMRDPRFIETVIYIVKDNSEGTLGLITEAWMRLQGRPDHRAAATVYFGDYFKAAQAVRAIVQAGMSPGSACAGSTFWENTAPKSLRRPPPVGFT